MWQKLGYEMIGIVPKVARLKGIEVENELNKNFFVLKWISRVWWMQNNTIMISQKSKNAQTLCKSEKFKFD